ALDVVGPQLQRRARADAARGARADAGDQRARGHGHLSLRGPTRTGGERGRRQGPDRPGGRRPLPQARGSDGRAARRSARAGRPRAPRALAPRAVARMSTLDAARDRWAGRAIAAVSFVVVGLVAYLVTRPRGTAEPGASVLPVVNAALNATAAVL